jgi:hypothetical protein
MADAAAGSSADADREVAMKYVDVDPEIPDVLGPACELCGDEFGPLMIGPCFTEKSGYWTGTRCVDGLVCRHRIQTTPSSQPEEER